MKKDKRVFILIFKLKVGLKCGGFDGLLGIIVNLLVGNFLDFLVF